MHTDIAVLRVSLARSTELVVNIYTYIYFYAVIIHTCKLCVCLLLVDMHAQSDSAGCVYVIFRLYHMCCCLFPPSHICGLIKHK